MKNISSAYKNTIKLFGRELDSIITYESNGDTIELGNEQLNLVSPHYEGGILKSVMKVLDIDSNVDIPLETVINYQFGVKVSDNTVEDYRDNYEYINFGNYIVYKSEKQEDTGSYKITCYDKMLYSMKNYENLSITYPITIRDYISAICSYLGLTFANSSDTFANYDKQLSSELFLDENGNSLNYTFRDVLDYLAEVTAGTICINDNDELEIRYPKNTANTGIITLDHITGSSSIKINQTVSSNHYITVKFKFKKVANCYIIYTTNGKLYYNNNVLYLYYGSSLRGSANYTFLEDTEYTVEVSHNQNSSRVYVNNDLIINNTTSGTTYSAQKDFFVQSSRSALVDVYLIKISNSSQDKYIPAFNSTTNQTGLYNSYQDDFANTTYIGDHSNANDTINEEYLKDINVNFGEKLMPINTVTLKRASDSDIYSLSISDQLTDDEKSEIVINNNPILNGTDRSDYASAILNKLYGLSFYINDFVSTGITYYDLLDEYNVTIDNSTYNCLMLNNDIQVTTGLTENVYCKNPSENTTYNTTSKTTRDDNRATIIVDKAKAEIDLKVDSDGVISAINLSPETISINSDKISLAGKTIDLTTDTITIASNYFNVEASGRITATSGNIAGFESNEYGFSYEIKTKKDYTQTDSDKLTNYIYNGGTLTDEEKELYDVNNDGQLTLSDIMMMNWFIQNHIGNSYPGNYKIMIPQTSSPTQSIIGLFNGYGSLISGFSWQEAKFPNININNNGVLSIKDNNSNNSITCSGSTGNITCVSLTQTSEEKFKKNFEKYNNALGIIKNIDIYKYNLIEENNKDKKHIGFVIGDNFKYSKDVTSQENDGVDLYSFISVCCKAIQEQQEIIEDLQKRIEKLEKGE